MWAGSRWAEYLRLAETFWETYHGAVAAAAGAEETAHLEQRTLANLAGCLLARVDGKSPVDYLSPNEQHCVREIGRDWLIHPPPTWADAVQQLEIV
jgi:hypothetical protein